MKSLFAVGAALAVVMAGPPAWAASSGPAPDIAAITAVLSDYKAAVEHLDPSGTERLFATDSAIFESGSAEGNYAHYLVHHLRPELADFRSFAFSDYTIDVRVFGDVATTAEVYHYRLVPKAGDPADRLGVATGVLRKANGKWQIISLHSSAHKPRP